MASPTADVEAMAVKREQNIRAREVARAARIQAIKAEKMHKAKERGAKQAAMHMKKAQEEEDLARQAETAKRREESINQREMKRLETGGLPRSKYAKADVLRFRGIYDEYDADGSGFITFQELKGALEQQRLDKMRRQKVRHEHQVPGQVLFDLVDAMFSELDRNGNGKVDFRELLRVMFPLATKEEMKTMLEWGTQKEPKLEAIDDGLKAAQIAELRKIFHIYDTDNDAQLSLAELVDALKSCGMTENEMNRLFQAADSDLSGKVSIDEFCNVMFRSDLF